MDKIEFIQEAALSLLCRPKRTDASGQFLYPSVRWALREAKELWDAVSDNGEHEAELRELARKMTAEQAATPPAAVPEGGPDIYDAASRQVLAHPAQKLAVKAFAAEVEATRAAAPAPSVRDKITPLQIYYHDAVGYVVKVSDLCHTLDIMPPSLENVKHIDTWVER